MVYVALLWEALTSTITGAAWTVKESSTFPLQVKGANEPVLHPRALLALEATEVKYTALQGHLDAFVRFLQCAHTLALTLSMLLVLMSEHVARAHVFACRVFLVDGGRWFVTPF